MPGLSGVNSGAIKCETFADTIKAAPASGNLPVEIVRNGQRLRITTVTEERKTFLFFGKTLETKVMFTPITEKDGKVMTGKAFCAAKAVCRKNKAPTDADFKETKISKKEWQNLKTYGTKHGNEDAWHPELEFVDREGEELATYSDASYEAKGALPGTLFKTSLEVESAADAPEQMADPLPPAPETPPPPIAPATAPAATAAPAALAKKIPTTPTVSPPATDTSEATRPEIEPPPFNLKQALKRHLIPPLPRPNAAAAPATPSAATAAPAASAKKIPTTPTVPPAAPAKRTPPPIPPPAHLLSPTYISKVKDNCQAITTAFR